MNSLINSVLPWFGDLLLGTFVVFMLSLMFAKRAGYIGRMLVVPRHLWQLLHGRVLCPQCMGMGHTDEGGLLSGTPCMFCLRFEHLADGTSIFNDKTIGYISFPMLWHDWDIRQWCPQPGRPGGRIGHVPPIG